MIKLNSSNSLRLSSFAWKKSKSLHLRKVLILTYSIGIDDDDDDDDILLDSWWSENMISVAGFVIKNYLKGRKILVSLPCLIILDVSR